MIIDLDYRPGARDISAGFRLFSQPFPHVVAPQLFSPALCSALLDFLESSAPWSDRHVDDFYDIHQVNLAGLSLPEEIRFLTTPGFFADLRRGLEKLFGCRLAPPVTLTAHKMMAGYRIKVHTDSGMGTSHRLLVHLNRGWSQEAGGVLMFLDSVAPDAPSENQQFLLPINGSAVAFEISPRSYHAVSPVVSGDRHTLSFSFSPASEEEEEDAAAGKEPRAEGSDPPPKPPNRLPRLGRFLRAWENRGALLNLRLVNVAPSDQGNIGGHGASAGFDGHSLTRWHPQFESIIEPKVRPLVRLLVDHFDWITYSSCEGHRFEGHPPILREVGMIARSAEEVETIVKILGRACGETNAEHTGSGVIVRPEVGMLHGDDDERPAVRLIFHRDGMRSFDEYFRSLDEVTATLVHRLILIYQEREFGLLQL